MPSEKSGGKRTADKKRAIQAVARGPEFDAAEVAAFAAVELREPTAAGALDEALAYLRVSMRRAASDPGVEPYARREQVARFAAMLAKSADPKKQIEALTNDLRELGAEVESIKVRHAARERRGTTPETSAPALTQ
jgi:hypothetical protein